MAPHPTPPPTTRPATPDDAEFLYQVYASTRYEELAPTGWPPEQVEAFLRMQFRTQDRHYRQHFPDASYEVILCGGAPAGRLYLLRRGAEFLVIDVALLPAFRRRGLGTFLLENILRAAADAGGSVRIHVEQYNRALELYERLGFARAGEAGVYLEMVARPGAAPVGASTSRPVAPATP